MMRAMINTKTMMMVRKRRMGYQDGEGGEEPAVAQHALADVRRPRAPEHRPGVRT